MEKELDNIDTHIHGYKMGFKPGEGPLITFQVTDENEVVCRFYHDFLEDTMEAIANDHNGHIEFHDVDHYYDDCLFTIRDYLKDEGNLKESDIESLAHVGGGFEEFKERLEELLSEAGCEMSEMVETELSQAEFYNDALENGKNTCDFTLYGEDDCLDKNTHQYFDEYSRLIKHILARGGKISGAVIHDKETKELLSGENAEILGNITDAKIKDKILENITNIVKEQKLYYPEAHAYLMTKDNSKEADREN